MYGTYLENNELVDIDLPSANIISNSCQIFVNVLNDDFGRVTRKNLIKDKSESIMKWHNAGDMRNTH